MSKYAANTYEPSPQPTILAKLEGDETQKGEDSMSINHLHTDSKKRRSFLALPFAAGDVRR